MRSNSQRCEKQRSLNDKSNEMLWARNGGISAWRQKSSISKQLLKFSLEIIRNKTLRGKGMRRMLDQKSSLHRETVRPPCCSNKHIVYGFMCLEKLTCYVHMVLSRRHTNSTALSWLMTTSNRRTRRWNRAITARISMWRRKRYSTTKGRYSNFSGKNAKWTAWKCL